jgi:hypothetical protein
MNSLLHNMSLISPNAASAKEEIIGDFALLLLPG